MFFVKTIQELMQIVKKLRDEVEAQVSENIMSINRKQRVYIDLTRMCFAAARDLQTPSVPRTMRGLLQARYEENVGSQ